MILFALNVAMFTLFHSLAKFQTVHSKNQQISYVYLHYSTLLKLRRNYLDVTARRLFAQHFFPSILL